MIVASYAYHLPAIMSGRLSLRVRCHSQSTIIRKSVHLDNFGCELSLQIKIICVPY